MLQPVELKLTCRECDRVFDLTNEADTEEFYFGHDCVKRVQLDDVPDYVAQLFNLSEKMLHAGLADWAIEVRIIAGALAEGLNLDKETN